MEGPTGIGAEGLESWAVVGAWFREAAGASRGRKLEESRGIFV